MGINWKYRVFLFRLKLICYFCYRQLFTIINNSETTNMNRILLHTLIIITLLASSCVPARKYKELEARHQANTEANEQLRRENEAAQTRNRELSVRITHLEQQVEQLKADTTQMASDILSLQREVANLTQTREQYEKLLEGRTQETRQILTRLQATQEDLQAREDQLRQATLDLQEKEKNLNALMNEVRMKELRVNELEAILARQDSAVQALRNTVSKALLGFENNGLTIEVKQGKVYVSLEESLLFASGSTSVDARGEAALKELAGVLEKNPEIHVLIEGHTDDVPLRPGAQIRDNWDLSVLRATAIVRILLKHSQMDPQRLTAAGKGEHLPLDSAKTAEARRKNRRTEIILTPRLDDLFQILEMN